MEAKFSKIYIARMRKQYPCMHALQSYSRDTTNLSVKRKSALMERDDIILATHEYVGHHLSKLSEMGQVAQVIVDECGMALSLIP